MKHERFLAICLLLISCTAISALQAAQVTATVVGPTGTPVKGAHVAVTTIIDGKTQDPEHQTDNNGRFTVDILEAPNPASPYYPARYIITASGLALSGGTWKKGETVFRLEQGLSLSGTVVDTAGKPEADSQVSLRLVQRKDQFQQIDVAPWLAATTGKFVAKSGADGRWTIPDVPRDGRASIWFADPHYLKNSVQFELSPTMPAVPPFIAQPGIRAAGRVLYETGLPAAGVHVAASASGMNGTVIAKTTADGSFLLPAMPFGRFNIRVQEGSGDWVAADLSGATHPIMQTLRLPDFVLQDGVLLTGVVLDVDTGVPREIYITPEQTQIEPFRLKRGLELSGTAVDEAGRPATGAQIRLTTSNGRSSPFDPFGWVDAEGRWTIKGIDLDQTPEALLTSDGSWEMTPVPLKLPTDRPLALTLRRVK